MRSEDQTGISISMSQKLLEDIDSRAAALGLNRSQYLSQLARADIASGGSLTLHETNSTASAAELTVAAAARGAKTGRPAPDRPTSYRARPRSKKKPAA